MQRHVLALLRHLQAFCTTHHHLQRRARVEQWAQAAPARVAWNDDGHLPDVLRLALERLPWMAIIAKVIAASAIALHRR